jgi:hypothetical protein
MAQERKRQVATIMQARAAYINGLWTPQTKDIISGQPLQKPRHSVTAIVPKTREKWTDEPVLGAVKDASQSIWNDALSPKGYSPGAIIWPVKDGDAPNKKGVVRDWAKGHWLIIADTTNPDYLQIEMVENGKPVPLAAPRIGGRVLVKDGDYVMLTVSLAESKGSQPGIKTYLNAILFTGPGEALTLGGGGVDQAELLRQAQAQGIAVKGFGSAPSGWSAPSGDSPF